MSKAEVPWQGWQQQLYHCRKVRNEIPGNTKQLDEKRSRQNTIREFAGKIEGRKINWSE